MKADKQKYAFGSEEKRINKRCIYRKDAIKIDVVLLNILEVNEIR